MKIIKTAQLAGLLGKADPLHHAIDDAHHEGNPDVDGANAEIVIDSEMPHVGEDTPLFMGEHTEHAGHPDSGGGLADEMGEIGQDIGQDISDGQPLDLNIEMDPSAGEGESPLDIEIDGHELPLDDMNDPSLQLDQIGGDDGQGFNELALDGDLDGTLHMDDAINHTHEHHEDHGMGGQDPMQDMGGHDPLVDGGDGGLDGLIVMDDGDDTGHLPA